MPPAVPVITEADAFLEGLRRRGFLGQWLDETERDSDSAITL